MPLQRLKKDIVTLGKMGRKIPIETDMYEQLDSDKGLWRLEGTKQAEISKEFIINRMKEAGLEVRIDKIGNIFGKREGTKPDRKAVMFGSHLDSVKNGGQFDGPLGVVTGLEALRVMEEEGFKNERPLELVVFMGEEGSAFKLGLLGSLVITGSISVEEALAIKNDDGMTLKESLEETDVKGDFEFNIDNVEYFVELHIEQGPVLDKEKIPIGIVENITGIIWIIATIEGEENHAGTTPMNLRRDPLVAASNVVLFASERAKEMVKEQGKSGSTVATVGKLVVFPSALNIVPGKVDLGIDIRDVVDKNIKLLREEIINNIKSLESKYGVKTSVNIPLEKPSSPCSQEVVNVIEQVTKDLGIKAKRMNSGAGHDAQNIAHKVKTAMIFVPSVNGISHAPMEWTNWEDIKKGLDVMVETLKRLSLQ